MFATQSLFYPEDDEDTDGSEKKQIALQVHRLEDIQARCCLTLKAKILASQMAPACCKSVCGSSKDRVLAAAHEHIKSSMYIDSLLVQLRAMEGVLREKLEINDKDWKRAKRHYGLLRV